MQRGGFNNIIFDTVLRTPITCYTAGNDRQPIGCLHWSDDKTRPAAQRAIGLLVFLTSCIREWTRFRNQDVPATSVAHVSGKTGRWRHSKYVGLVSLTSIVFAPWPDNELGGGLGLVHWPGLLSTKPAYMALLSIPNNFETKNLLAYRPILSA